MREGLEYGEVLAAVVVLTALAVMLSLGISLGFAACRASQSHPVVTPEIARQTGEAPCRCGTRGPVHG